MELKETVHVTYQHVRETLRQFDKAVETDPNASSLPSDGLRQALEEVIHLQAHEKRAVLGIDVYRYSQLGPLEQSLVPFVLRLLYNQARDWCRTGSAYLFQKYTEQDFADHYIDTGDGGFLLFDTPVHALAFAVDFELALRAFNSFRYYPRLRSVLGTDISLRYAMTYGDVFSFETSFYGPSIITNARLLSKDHLNRFLIDQNTFDWYTKAIRGIENMPCIGLRDLQSLPDFADYDSSLIDKDEGLYFPRESSPKDTPWKDVDVLKLGDVPAKSQTVCVYGLHIHYLSMLVDDSDNTKRVRFTISLGNLNTSGIE